MDVTTVLDDIVTKITSYKKARKVVLFGSRARGDNAPTSDIDVAIIDPEWTRRDVALVHELLEEEVPTPLKIDLLALHLIEGEELKRRILSEARVLYERADDQRA